MKKIICFISILMICACFAGYNYSTEPDPVFEQEEAYCCIVEELLCENEGYSYERLLDTLMDVYGYDEDAARVGIEYLNFTERDWINEAKKEAVFMFDEYDNYYPRDKMIYELTWVYGFTEAQSEVAADEVLSGDI